MYLKQIKGAYSTREDVIRLLKYISNKSKCPNRFWGSNNLEEAVKIFTKPKAIADQFIEYQPENARKRVYHFVLSFGDKDFATYDIAMQIGDKFCRLYRDYQSVYIIHENKRNLHFHFVINNFSINKAKNLSYKLNIIRMEDEAKRILRDN